VDISLFSSTGESKGQVNLKDYFGDEEFQGRTLHEVVTTYQRNMRSGTSMTKTRGLVRGGGRKPWKQKGTGNARAGSIRSPLWRKGGIIFGPVPRSFRVELPEAKRNAALRSAIWLKAKEGTVVVVEQIDAAFKKTKQALGLVQKLSATGKALILDDKFSSEQRRVFSNLQHVSLSAVADLNALDVLRSKMLVITLPALKSLSQRVGGAAHA